MFRKIIVASSAVLTSIVLAATPVMATVMYNSPTNSSFKSYMGYRAITNKSSVQWELEKGATTNADGLRMLNDRYLVAIGTGFNAPVGTDIEIFLDTGMVIPATVGDLKANRHTDSSNRQSTLNGNVVEFIVDSSELDPTAKFRGDISVLPGFGGNVVNIAVHEPNGMVTNTFTEIAKEKELIDNSEKVAEAEIIKEEKPLEEDTEKVIEAEIEEIEIISDEIDDIEDEEELVEDIPQSEYLVISPSRIKDRQIIANNNEETEKTMFVDLTSAENNKAVATEVISYSVVVNNETYEKDNKASEEKITEERNLYQRPTRVSSGVQTMGANTYTTMSNGYKKPNILRVIRK